MSLSSFVSVSSYGEAMFTDLSVSLSFTNFTLGQKGTIVYAGSNALVMANQSV